MEKKVSVAALRGVSQTTSRPGFVTITGVLQGKHTLVDPKYGDDTIQFSETSKPTQPISALRFSKLQSILRPIDSFCFYIQIP